MAAQRYKTGLPNINPIAEFHIFHTPLVHDRHFSGHFSEKTGLEGVDRLDNLQNPIGSWSLSHTQKTIGMICTHCQFENPDSMKFCGNYGAPQNVSCPSCHFENPPGFKFCGSCGDSLSLVSAAENALTSTEVEVQHSPDTGERRHLTVMFCDLVGSTALSNQLDPEDLRAIVREYQDACSKVVARYEGHIAQFLGDGIMVYFGFPTAHENDAHRAVSSGLGIIEVIQRINTRLVKTYGVQISVRLGIHTGHVVIGDMGDGDQTQQLALGATPNIAARLEGLAEPNTLVISAETYALVDGFFLCEDQGKHSVKGISDQIQIYKAIHENVARTRLEAQAELGKKTPIVGRDSEINRLYSLWDEAKSGRSHMVLLSGEPGLGKSRIVQAMVQHVAKEEDAWLVFHHCSPYHKQTAFYPVADVIEHVVLQFKPDEPGPDKIMRLEGFLLQYGLDLEEMVPLFAAMLSLTLDETNYRTTPFSPEQQKQKVINALLTMYLERAKEQNLLVIYEDLQWIDPSTLEIINQLIKQSPTLNILTILSFRPEFKPPWRMQRHLISMALANLSQDAVRQIILKISGGKQLPEQVIDQIIQKTDGIPLFVEELTKMVLGSEFIEEHQNHFELKGPVASLAIPSTLHDSLVARLDRMSHTKEIAQLGAVIGREFHYDLIRVSTTMKENALRTCLDELVQAELLLQSGYPPNASFKFRHALIKDAAYQSLLKSQRQSAHKRIARSLISDLPEFAENRPEIVAYHCEQSNQTSTAIIYLTKSAHKVLNHQAFDEALNLIDQALKLLEQVDDESLRNQLERDLLLMQAPTLIITREYTSKEAFAASHRLKELAEILEDDVAKFRALRGIITHELFSGHPNKALSYARDALGVADSTGSTELIMEANRLLGQVSIYTGDLQQSLQSFDKSITLLESIGADTFPRLIGADSGVFSLIQSSHVCWYLGYPDQARSRAEQAIVRANEIDKPYSHALCRFIYSLVLNLSGDYETAILYGNMGIDSAEKFGFTMFAHEIKTLCGYAMVRTGDTDNGIEMMNTGVAWRVNHSMITGMYLHVSLLAKAHLMMGDHESAMAAVNRALTLTETSDDELFLSEIYRFKGEILSVENQTDQSHLVEEYLTKSMHIAKRQGAKSFELRSAISLARHNHMQGKTQEGLALLIESYNWFTEGFETHDLIEAKKLIDNYSLILQSD